MSALIFILSLIAVTVLPGVLVAWRARLPLRIALLAAPALTFGIVAAGVSISDVFGARWNAVTALITLVVFVAMAEAYGWMLSRRQRGRHPDDITEQGTTRWTGRDYLPLLGVAGGAGLIMILYLRYLTTVTNGIDNIFQSWDAHWHANVLAFISEEGIAAPNRMGELHNQFEQAPMYYPTAWHALVSIPQHWADLTTMAEYNLGALTILALVMPWAVAALAGALTGRRTAALAGIITVFFGSLVWIEIYVAAIPAATSMMLGVIGAVLSIYALRDRRAVPLAILALFGALATQPQGLLVAVFLLVSYWLFHALFVPVRSRLGDFLTLAAIGVGALITAIPTAIFLLTVNTESGSDFARNFEIDGLDRMGSFGAAATMMTRHSEDFSYQYALTALAAVGAVVLIARRQLWPVLAWVWGVVLSTHAIKYFDTPVGDVLQIFTDPFYSDSRRINVWVSVLVAAAVAVALGWALDAISSAVRRQRGRSPAHPLVTVAVVVSLFATGLVVLQDFGRTSAQESRAGRQVGERDLRAYEWLARQPGAYSGSIYTNPDEGNGWMYAYNRLPSTARHYRYTGDVEPAAFTMVSRLNRAGSDPEVDAIIRDNNIRFVYISPPNYWGPEIQPPNEMLLNLDKNAPGLTEVYHDHEVQIFAVNQTVSDSEIAAMLDDSPHPPGAEPSPAPEPVPAPEAPPEPAPAPEPAANE